MTALFRLQIPMPRKTHQKLIFLAEETSKKLGRRVRKSEIALKLIEDFLDNYQLGEDDEDKEKE